MEPAINVLRALLRRALNEYGRIAPALSDITIERARRRRRPRLGAQFSNGHHVWTSVTADDCYEFCETHSAWDLESLRSALLHEAREIYRQMVDDHRIEIGLHEQREQLGRQQRVATSALLVARLRREAYDVEQQIERHHRTRSLDGIQSATGAVSFRRDPPHRLRGWWLQRWYQISRSAIPRRGLFDHGGHEGAQARAERLLKENLSPIQRDQFKRLGYFEVTGGESGKRYRIRRGHQMNVEQLDKNGKRRGLLCFMPEGHLAVGDVMLAQKMALELFESDALKIANKMHPQLSI